MTGRIGADYTPDAIEVTTFGIYGFETGGHHFPEKDESDHMSNDDHKHMH